MTDLGMNERAWAIADNGIGRAMELRIGARHLANGSRVIDAGVDAPGGLGAGLLLANCAWVGWGTSSTHRSGSMANPGRVFRYGQTTQPNAVWPRSTAGWAIAPEGFFAMGSGPLRARARVERALFEKLGYSEQSGRGVTRARRGRAPD